MGESKCIFGKNVSAAWIFIYFLGGGGDKYIHDHIREAIDHAAKSLGIFCAYIAAVVCDGMA